MVVASTNNNESNIVSNVLGSASAGIIARILTHPLDTCKARLQSFNGRSYRGFSDALLSTFKERSLYRGFSATIIGGTPGTIIYLCSYDIFKQKLLSAGDHNEENVFVHFLSGILAETVACLIYVPVDVIKERCQIQHKTDSMRYKGSWDALIQITKNEGLSGIYKGYGATLASFGPFSAFYFVLYEQFKCWSRDYYYLRDENNDENTTSKRMPPTTLPLAYTISCSASAGAIASFITSPLDMVKLRLQVQRGALSSTPYTELKPITVPSYRGMSDALAHAWKTGGFTALFKGAGARVVHFTSLTTVTMTSYETCRNFFYRNLAETN